MGMPSGTELLLIFGIIVLLFGAKKIPDLAKGLGKGIKNFKDEMKDVNEEVASNEPKKVEGDNTTEVASKTEEAPKNTTQA
ncbi:Sec-independent protein translocase subunit TatA/TatB [Sulfurimonas marina]|uniref:Sec-independent protein translocase protein TatA n=1 Tax=Sulfurimonas marina TaxID=2590551 RepID=A0A7M1AT02_9BACT|nr:twin-arginine translocase TatA/TatE family subunit [Sulfurimonas marina]QOP40544.1 twin-arginine translocase TatA/TatE family subunit [Sulfurimonas marina]